MSFLPSSFYFVLPRIPGNFAATVGLNRRNKQEELLDYGKEMFRNSIGHLRFRVWNGCTLERRYRYG